MGKKLKEIGKIANIQYNSDPKLISPTQFIEPKPLH